MASKRRRISTTPPPERTLPARLPTDSQPWGANTTHADTTASTSLNPAAPSNLMNVDHGLVEKEGSKDVETPALEECKAIESKVSPVPPPPAPGQPSRHKPRRRKASADQIPEEPPEVPPPVYYFEHGLRKVEPYYYTYTTYAKGRWLGRTLLDVFRTEFRDQDAAYYQAAITSGLIRINQAVVTPATVIKNLDRISHAIHRHEPPVTATLPRIVAQTADLVVVDKPGSMSVHPSGRYHHNTLLHILRYEMGWRNEPLAPVNRLDRLTSGLVLLARNTEAARRIERQMNARTILKEYVCRVVGDFPTRSTQAATATTQTATDEVVKVKEGKEEEEDTLATEGNEDVTTDNRGGPARLESASSVIRCDQPIKTVAHKLGLNAVHPDGKPSVTLFRKVSTGQKTATVTRTTPVVANTKPSYSLVRCQPLTGRTHQIRVHLQYLGHPIGNDPLYSDARIWGDDNDDGNNDNVPRDSIDQSKTSASFRNENGGSAHNGQGVIMAGGAPSEDAIERAKARLLRMDAEREAERTGASVPTTVPEVGPRELLLHDGAAGSTSSTTTRQEDEEDQNLSLLPRGYEESCPQCRQNRVAPLPDPEPHQLFIWLHACKYTGDGWTFETELPAWFDGSEVDRAGWTTLS
ncbi:DRAP deaminase [Tieghemiomyces parasiticus]|uniref:DRAP deaminase n=1 Tax=Tieghemiomyces parasiticus TaxID=78921 RepID=A0A9W8A722_9FUNG|nr:DRAP deaminase [Tieghemiomyces parasiticus]